MAKTRGVLVAGNWKMNHTLRETEQFFADFGARAQEALNGAARGKYMVQRGCDIPGGEHVNLHGGS